jgi:aminoglycoside 6'-N-acetyltransferase
MKDMPAPLQRKVLELRSAEPSDVSLLRLWDAQPHLLASKGNEDWEWDKELHRTPKWREQLIAEMDGRPIGFVQIIDPAQEETQYWGNVPENLRAIDIWIGNEGNLGKGYGSQMMRLALEKCFAHPRITGVLVDPLINNPRAHRFYEKHGFLAVGPRWFGVDHCLVYRLERTTWENITCG